MADVNLSAYNMIHSITNTSVTNDLKKSNPKQYAILMRTDTGTKARNLRLDRELKIYLDPK